METYALLGIVYVLSGIGILGLVYYLYGLWYKVWHAKLIPLYGSWLVLISIVSILLSFYVLTYVDKYINNLFLSAARIVGISDFIIILLMGSKYDKGQRGGDV